MGLIKAAVGALGGTLADQWREYVYCDAMPENVLVTKGKKRTSDKRSSNTKGEDNILTNGSVIAVNEGQCMIVVDQGKVVELCAEAGEFIYDTSTEPSIFYGGLGKGLLNTFKTIGKRITFGGDTGKDQRVYFFNTKEILGNKYGTANPVPFRVVDRNIGLDIDIGIRCHGEYSYKIIDPMLFYANVCGNVTADYTRDRLDGQLKTELMTALQPAFARISAQGIRYSALPGHTMEIAQALNEVAQRPVARAARHRRRVLRRQFGRGFARGRADDQGFAAQRGHARPVDGSRYARRRAGGGAQGRREQRKRRDDGLYGAWYGAAGRRDEHAGAVPDGRAKQAATAGDGTAGRWLDLPQVRFVVHGQVLHGVRRKASGGFVRMALHVRRVQ